MSDHRSPVTLDVEDAFNVIVRCLREGGYAQYGYDLYLPKVIRQYLAAAHGIRDGDAERLIAPLSSTFYAAAWELCRRGILRPGVRAHYEQVTDDGSGGNGYSVTPLGIEWLQQASQYDYAPLEPGRLSRLLDTYAPRFGQGFRERAQEALRCYGANAYLGCCAMCGAAAESIMLAVAVARTGDEPKVLRMYESSGGRGRIENLILGQQPPGVQADFRSSSSLLKYWRDSAAHGRRSSVTDNEAYTSLTLLLRFAQFANDRWTDLTAHP